MHSFFSVFFGLICERITVSVDLYLSAFLLSSSLFLSFSHCICSIVTMSRHAHEHTTASHFSEMEIFRLSLEFQLFDGPGGYSRDLSKFAEKSCMCIYIYIYVHYNHELLTPCAPATIMSAILYQFSLL